MKDPQDILDERPDDFKKPPMRWNTGLLQYEVDLDHEEPVDPSEGPRSWVAFWGVLPFAIDVLIVFAVLFFVLVFGLYLLLGL